MESDFDLFTALKWNLLLKVPTKLSTRSVFVYLEP